MTLAFSVFSFIFVTVVFLSGSQFVRFFYAYFLCLLFEIQLEGVLIPMSGHICVPFPRQNQDFHWRMSWSFLWSKNLDRCSYCWYWWKHWPSLSSKASKYGDGQEYREESNRSCYKPPANKIVKYIYTRKKNKLLLHYHAISSTQFTVKEQDAPGDLSRTHSKFYFNLNKFSVFKF